VGCRLSGPDILCMVTGVDAVLDEPFNMPGRHPRVPHRPGLAPLRWLLSELQWWDWPCGAAEGANLAVLVLRVIGALSKPCSQACRHHANMY
jgi:hypothetical protein